jgi:Mn2+/Fe2+ NRAMP family transporter
MTQAKAFYGVIVGSMLLGLIMNFSGLNPVRALYWSAMLNGLAAPPLIVMILMLARRKDVLGEHASGRVSQSFVALAAIVSTALPLLYVIAK